MNNGVLCTLHRFQFRIKTKLRSGMEKYSSTILYIAEILSQGSLRLQVHGWTTAPTYRPSKTSEYKKTASLLSVGKVIFYPFASASLFKALTIDSGCGESNSHSRRVTNTWMLGKLRELRVLTLTQTDTAKWDPVTVILERSNIKHLSYKPKEKHC